MTRVLATYNIKGGVGQDLGRRQPRLPRGARGRAHAALGPRPAGREHLPVPGQAEGQGRRHAARARQARRPTRDQGHRPRAPGPAAGRLLLPPHRSRAGRHQAPDAPAGARAGAAAGRLRLHLPRLPAEHLAGLRERVRGRRRAARPADPGDALLAHVRPARASRRRRRDAAGPGVLLDGRRPQAPAPRGDGAAAAEHPGVLRTAIPASADVERMGVRRTALEEFAPHGRAAPAYRDLWREIQERLDSALPER